MFVERNNQVVYSTSLILLSFCDSCLPDLLNRWPMLRDHPIWWIKGLCMWHQKSSVLSSLSSYTNLNLPPITLSTTATLVRHKCLLSTTSTLMQGLKGYCILSETFKQKQKDPIWNSQQGLQVVSILPCQYCIYLCICFVSSPGCLLLC